MRLSGKHSTRGLLGGQLGEVCLLDLGAPRLVDPPDGSRQETSGNILVCVCMLEYAYLGSQDTCIIDVQHSVPTEQREQSALTMS